MKKTLFMMALMAAVILPSHAEMTEKKDTVNIHYIHKTHAR
jgi:hypothetical protein